MVTSSREHYERGQHAVHFKNGYFNNQTHLSQTYMELTQPGDDPLLMPSQGQLNNGAVEKRRRGRTGCLNCRRRRKKC
jgi:hypothetical protein